MELEVGGRRYELTGPEVAIGSDPACGLVLSDLLPRHAAIRLRGVRMASVRSLTPEARIEVNGVGVGLEAMPLLHGDVLRLGPHEVRVVNPSHPVGSAGAPPEGARERLHDTFFGLPRAPAGAASSPGPLVSSSPRPTPPSRLSWIVISALVSLGLLVFLLLR